WLHVVLGLVTVICMWVGGVYLFRDYARPATAAANSRLPDIYLITFDALRADDTSVYGYDRPTTPNLSKLAQQSFVFDYFFASSQFTPPTTTTVEAGQQPWSHRVLQGGGFLHRPEQSPPLAAMLLQHGYYTATITSNFMAGPFRHRTLEGYDSVELE